MNPPSACFITGMNVFPTATTLNHNAAAPANSQHFDAFEKGSGRVSFEKKMWGDKQ